MWIIAKIVVCAIVLVNFFDVPGDVRANKICGKNEVWKNCSTSCPHSCATRGALIKCTADCYVGCVCNEDTIRKYIKGKELGPCIDPCECPKKCE